jgi:hypothetical protein
MLHKEGLCNISVLPGYCTRGQMVVGLLKVVADAECNQQDVQNKEQTWGHYLLILSRKSTISLFIYYLCLISQLFAATFLTTWTFPPTHQKMFNCALIHSCTLHFTSLELLMVQLLGGFVKLRKANVSFVISTLPSVSPHRTTPLPMEVFSRNSKFVCVFSKICREISSFIEMWQEQGGLYRKTYAHLW